MGGVGSGSWYRSGKKSTVEECRSFDVRRLHREGLLQSGRRFSWSWSRAGRQTASIAGVVLGASRPERVVLLFRHRSGPGAKWEDAQQPVELRATSAGRGHGSFAPE